jgi:hypothetical protein
MRYLMLAVFLVGCGGELPGDGPPDPIVGLWGAAQSCVTTFAFSDDGTYSQAMACSIDGSETGPLGVQLETGSYTDDGDRLVLSTAAATCPWWPKTSSATYAVAPGRLQLSGPGAIMILTPGTEAAGEALGATPGCFFAPNGVAAPFARLPLSPI